MKNESFKGNHLIHLRNNRLDKAQTEMSVLCPAFLFCEEVELPTDGQRALVYILPGRRDGSIIMYWINMPYVGS